MADKSQIRKKKSQGSRRAAARKRRAQVRQKRIMGSLALGLAAVACALTLFVVFWPSGEPAPVSAARETARPTIEPEAILATAAPTPLPSVSPSPTLNEPTPSPTPALRSARIRSIGDFVIHDEILSSAYSSKSGEYDFSDMLSMVEHELANADFTVANVDGVMQGGSKKTYRGYPYFNTPPELMTAMLDSGIDMITLANNHVLDFKLDGLKKMMEKCVEYGMDFIGAARSQEERDVPQIREINGINVGFLNYTDNLNRKERYFSKSVLEYLVIKIQNANVKKDIARLREVGADVVVVYMHWGTEYDLSPNSSQKKYAKKIADAGADVIIGSHPHVLQPVKWIETKDENGAARRCLCAYSLGNFLANKGSERRDTGVIFEFTIEETSPGKFEITSPTYIPTYIWRYGSGSGKYKFRVVICDELREDRPEEMTSSVQKKIGTAYSGAKELIGSDVAQVGGARNLSDW